MTLIWVHEMHKLLHVCTYTVLTNTMHLIVHMGLSILQHKLSLVSVCEGQTKESLCLRLGSDWLDLQVYIGILSWAVA